MPIRGSPNGGPLNPVHAFPQAIPWWTSSLGIGGRHQSVRVDVINRFCWSPSLGTPRQSTRSIRQRTRPQNLACKLRHRQRQHGPYSAIEMTTYRRHLPGPPLSEFIEVLWLYENPQPSHASERVLPTGTVELVINLHEDAGRSFDSVVA